MPQRISAHLRPLARLLGTWAVVGQLLDEAGVPVDEIRGTATYTLTDDGHWIVHDADLTVFGQHSLVHELIGGNGGEAWDMYAFNAFPAPTVMSLRLFSADILMLDGEETRATLHLGPGQMFASWESTTGEAWLPSMQLAYTALNGGSESGRRDV